MGTLCRCEMGPSQAAVASAKDSGNFARVASAGVTATALMLVLPRSRPSQQFVFRGAVFWKMVVGMT